MRCGRAWVVCETVGLGGSGNVAEGGEGLIDGDGVCGRLGLRRREAGEVAVDAEPNLLIGYFVTLHLAVGLGMLLESNEGVPAPLLASLQAEVRAAHSGPIMWWCPAASSYFPQY